MYFTVEEENLICLYHNADRHRTGGKSPGSFAGHGQGNGGAGLPDRR